MRGFYHSYHSHQYDSIDRMIKYKSQIQYLLLTISTLLILLVPLATFDLLDTKYWYNMGLWSGNASVFALLLALLPGMLKRFKVGGSLKQIQIPLMFFRRQIGILAFSLALVHYAFIKLLPFYLIEGGTGAPTFLTFEVFGLIAFWLMFAMFLTSNNFSVKIMGKCWRYLHKVVYVVVWLILIHVAMQQVKLVQTVLILIMALLETASLIYASLNRKNTQVQNP